MARHTISSSNNMISSNFDNETSSIAPSYISHQENKNIGYFLGGIVGYKRFFAEAMNFEEFTNYTFPTYRFGFRLYLVYDFTLTPTQKAFQNYNNFSYNANFDILYNIFPRMQNWDLGLFVGVSLGFTNYNLKNYKINGQDYATNIGLRFSFWDNHSIEFYTRLGLNTLEYEKQEEIDMQAQTSEIKTFDITTFFEKPLQLGIRYVYTF